jgi:hypothetical protein
LLVQALQLNGRIGVKSGQKLTGTEQFYESLIIRSQYGDMYYTLGALK